jgi:mRNA N6-methyladenine demethylase
MAAIHESRKKDQPKTAPFQPTPPFVVSDFYAKDAMLAWFHGEFAAANAIIDALCGHLAQIAPSSNDYDSAFAAVHRRRLNWIPVADVTLELRKVVEKKTESVEGTKQIDEEVVESVGNGGVDDPAEVTVEDDSPVSEITDSGNESYNDLLLFICFNF